MKRSIATRAYKLPVGRLVDTMRRGDVISILSRVYLGFTSLYSRYTRFGHEVGRWALGLGVGRFNFELPYFDL